MQLGPMTGALEASLHPDAAKSGSTRVVAGLAAFHARHFCSAPFFYCVLCRTCCAHL